MSALGIIRAVLELIKQLFSYGKKVEKHKLEELADSRRHDKLDWLRSRMSNNATPKAGRDEADHPGK
jgi:hypothetical protein